MNVFDAAPDRKRVLFLATNLVGGGAEEQVALLARGLKGRGWQVLAVTLRCWPEYPAFAGSGIEVISLGMNARFPDPRPLARLAALIRDFRPAIVHSHMAHANLLARTVRAIADVPVLICTLHGHKMYGRRRDRAWINHFAHRFTDCFADLTTAVSHAAGAEYARSKVATPGKLRVMANGVDAARLVVRPGTRERVRAELGLGSEFAWLAVGRFDWPKDYGSMLRGFACLGGEGVLLLCGVGLEFERMERLAKSLRCDGRVRFLGYRRDIPELMSAADGYVMSSVAEGLPMVLLEASAAGLPVVATRVGGNQEIVLDGRSGKLVPPRDPASLAEAMREIMALPGAARSAMGVTGCQHVSANFSIEAVVSRWEELYSELAAGVTRFL